MLAGCCCSASGGLQVHCELGDSEDCDKNNGFCLKALQLPALCSLWLKGRFVSYVNAEDEVDRFYATLRVGVCVWQMHMVHT